MRPNVFPTAGFDVFGDLLFQTETENNTVMWRRCMTLPCSCAQQERESSLAEFPALVDKGKYARVRPLSVDMLFKKGF